MATDLECNKLIFASFFNIIITIIIVESFSLIDLVEKPFLQNMLEATGDDVELLQRRLHGVKNSLRIGLTNRTVQPLFRNPKAYCYVDQYRDAQDIVAVCMLSSFVPGGTGLFSGSSETIVRSSKRLREMVELGFVKKETPDGKGEIISLPPSPVVDDENESTHEESEDVDETSKKKEEDSSKFMFIDGGLSNVFPIYDSDTVVVTPFCGIFDPNPSICPKPGAAGDNNNLFRLSHRAKIYKTRQNAHTLRRMAFSSDEIKLQERYTSGYDDAKRFLSDNNLLKVHSVVAA